MRRGVLLILAIAAIWRAALLIEIRGTPLSLLHEWTESDMSSFLIQAERFRDGDWLARAPYYPYHGWMERIPLEEWARWHPPAMYYQPPLYSYAIAGMMRAGADPIAWIPWLQGGLGVLATALMIALTRRLFGDAAALGAGLMQAIYGPLIMTESQILRDGPILAETLAILLLAIDTLGRERRGTLASGERCWRAWLIGMLAGLMAMLHEGAMFLALFALIWGAGNAWRRKGRSAALQWAVLLIFGAVVGLSPMLARNAALGVPLAPRYFGSALAMATASHPDIAEGIMLPDDRARFDADMRAAQGNPAILMPRMIADYGANWPRFFRRWGWRLLALALGAEVNENLNYTFFKQHAPILNLSLDFRWLLPPALAGAMLLGWRRWRARAGGGLGLVAAFGLTMIGLVSLVQPYGRYRLIFLPLLAPLAGFAIAKFTSALAIVRSAGVGEKSSPSRKRPTGSSSQAGRSTPLKRGYAALATAVGLTAGLALLQAAVAWAPNMNRIAGLRPTEILVYSRTLLRLGNPEGAVDELKRGLDVFPRSDEIRVEWLMAEAIALQEKQDYAGAHRNWTEALGIRPDNPLAVLGETTSREGKPLGVPKEQFR